MEAIANVRTIKEEWKEHFKNNSDVPLSEHEAADMAYEKMNTFCKATILDMVDHMDRYVAKNTKTSKQMQTRNDLIDSAKVRCEPDNWHEVSKKWRVLIEKWLDVWNIKTPNTAYNWNHPARQNKRRRKQDGGSGSMDEDPKMSTERTSDKEGVPIADQTSKHPILGSTVRDDAMYLNEQEPLGESQIILLEFFREYTETHVRGIVDPEKTGCPSSSRCLCCVVAEFGKFDSRKQEFEVDAPGIPEHLGRDDHDSLVKAQQKNTAMRIHQWFQNLMEMKDEESKENYFFNSLTFAVTKTGPKSYHPTPLLDFLWLPEGEGEEKRRPAEDTRGILRFNGQTSFMFCLPRVSQMVSELVEKTRVQVTDPTKYWPQPKYPKYFHDRKEQAQRLNLRGFNRHYMDAMSTLLCSEDGDKRVARSLFEATREHEKNPIGRLGFENVDIQKELKRQQINGAYFSYTDRSTGIKKHASVCGLHEIKQAAPFDWDGKTCQGVAKHIVKLGELGIRCLKLPEFRENPLIRVLSHCLLLIKAPQDGDLWQRDSTSGVFYQNAHKANSLVKTFLPSSWQGITDQGFWWTVHNFLSSSSIPGFDGQEGMSALDRLEAIRDFASLVEEMFAKLLKCSSADLRFSVALCVIAHHMPQDPARRFTPEERGEDHEKKDNVFSATVPLTKSGLFTSVWEGPAPHETAQVGDFIYTGLGLVSFFSPDLVLAEGYHAPIPPTMVRDEGKEKSESLCPFLVIKAFGPNEDGQPIATNAISNATDRCCLKEEELKLFKDGSDVVHTTEQDRAKSTYNRSLFEIYDEWEEESC